MSSLACSTDPVPPRAAAVLCGQSCEAVAKFSRSQKRKQRERRCIVRHAIRNSHQLLSSLELSKAQCSPGLVVEIPLRGQENTISPFAFGRLEAKIDTVCAALQDLAPFLRFASADYPAEAVAIVPSESMVEIATHNVSASAMSSLVEVAASKEGTSLHCWCQRRISPASEKSQCPPQQKQRRSCQTRQSWRLARTIFLLQPCRHFRR